LALLDNKLDAVSQKIPRARSTDTASHACYMPGIYYMLLALSVILTRLVSTRILLTLGRQLAGLAVITAK